MSNDTAGHVGYVILIAGTAALAVGYPQGFVLRVLGSVIWTAIGWRMGMRSIWLWSGVFAIIDLLGALRIWS